MTPVSARNIEFVGHSDQQGRGDGVQVMVHKGHAFVGHMFADGFTVTDVRDPKHPRPVNFVAAPPNTRAFHLQTHGDLLLTVNSPNIWVHARLCRPERLLQRLDNRHLYQARQGV